MSNIDDGPLHGRVGKATTRSSKLTRDVRAFMHAAQQATPATPAVPADDVVRLRLRLIAEEFCELLDACIPDYEDGDDADTWRSYVGSVRSAARAISDHARLKVDLVEVADALADMEFVTRGTSLAFGIDPDAVADEVARSNMSKTPFEVLPGGKVRKGPNFSPPDIAGVLAKRAVRP